MKRVALYVRVSHEEQVKHGLSVDAQINALKDYAKANNYKIAKIYSDAGISARKSYKKRPALLEMVKDCQKGEIDLILICKLDRFFRSVPDYYAVMEQIGNIPWKAIHEDYETETASGVFKVNIMLSVAQSEADRTSERIKRVFEYKKGNGEVCTGGVATGYVIKDKRWYIDKEVEPAIRTFYKTYENTLSLKESVIACGDAGLKITSTIGRKFLYGDCYWGNAPYVAEPYITQEQHDFFIKSKPYRKKHSVKHQYIFSGLIKCHICGGNLTGERTIHIRKDGSEQHSVRYTCTHNRYEYKSLHASISEKVLENYILENISNLLDEYNLSVTAVTNSENKRELANLKARLNRIKDLYELGDITFTEYKDKRALLLDKIASIENIPTQKIKALPNNWRELYAKLDIQHKTVFWANVIDHIEVDCACCKEPFIFF